MPKLRFAPKRISLAFDPTMTQALLDLRDRRELSRSTLLGEFDFSQDGEARKLEMEAEVYDDIFQTAVPFNSPANSPNSGDPNTDPRTGGRNKGGSRNGGGRPQGSGDPAKPRKEGGSK